MKNFKKMFWSILLLSPSLSHADLFTVVQDAQMLKATMEQIDHIKTLKTNLDKQLDELTNQKKILESTRDTMVGHYGYSSLFKNQSLSTWQQSGSDWSSLLNSTDSTPLSTLKQKIESEFPVKESKTMFTNPESEQAKLYDLLAKTTVASRASNTLAYNSINEELLMLEKLQQEIEKSPNQKATLDLIARIQIEEAKLMAYQIKSQAVSGQLTGLQNQKEVSDAKWANEFFKWHN